MGGIILEMTGYINLKLVNSFVRLFLYLSLNVLLIPRWGIVGAATAALVGEGTINLLRLLEVFVLFRLLPYNRSFFKPVGAGLLTLAIAWAIGQWGPAEAGLLYTAIHVLILLAVYVGTIVLLGLSLEDRLLLVRLRQRASTMFSRS
jgi:O-antigen/teichoic acid export membrane protein